MIEAYLPNTKVILKWSFNNKIDLLSGLGLISKNIESKLKIINTIRNKFSHNYGYKLSKEDILSIKNIDKSPEIIIPKQFQKVPNINEIIILTKAQGYMRGYLDVVSEKGPFFKNK